MTKKLPQKNKLKKVSKSESRRLKAMIAEALPEEKLGQLTEAAIGKLEELLEATTVFSNGEEKPAVATQLDAAKEILSRTLGQLPDETEKPLQIQLLLSPSGFLRQPER